MTWPPGAVRPRVLMYHGVGAVPRERDPFGMFVTPDVFRAQMEWLLEHDFHFLSEADYLAALGGLPVDRRSVLVTFDDGYRGVAELAAPILEELGIPSILFVPSALVGRQTTWLDPRERHQLMNAAELREVRDAGMAIGAHGRDHQDLALMGGRDLVRHTRGAREELAAVTGTAVRTFAYPFGNHSAAARDAVRDAGYDAAFAVHDGTGRFAIPRTDVNATDNGRTFRVKLLPIYPAARRASSRVPYVRRAAHTVLGRQR